MLLKYIVTYFLLNGHRLMMSVESRVMVGKVEGIVGQPIVIPCDITPPTPDDSPLLVLWYKNIFGTPISSVDLRNGLEAASRWVDQKVLHGNVRLSLLQEGPSLFAYLNISETKATDSGPYRCRVDFWKAATRNFKIYVDLSKEADMVNIYNEKGQEIGGKVISTRENGSVTLTCKSYGGNPLPSHYWEIEGKGTIQVNETFTDNNVVTSRMELKQLQVNDSGRKVWCRASNNKITAPPGAYILTEIILAPVRVEMSRTVSTFVVGKNYNLTCQVLGSNPVPSTNMWVGTRQLPNKLQRESSDGKIFTIVSEFMPTAQDNGRFIKCRAFNKFVPQETLEDQWKITVVFPPIAQIQSPNITFLDSQSVIIVQKGSKVVMSCTAESNPNPYEYHWRHNGASKVLSHSGSSQLIIYEAQESDAGNYSCLAENSQGIGESDSVMMSVQYAPRCTHNDERSVYISVHESVDLACEMDANPANLTFVWHIEAPEKENTSGHSEVPKSQFTQHGLKSVLTLTPRTPSDFGRVSCVAKNHLGSESACSFIVNKKVVTSGVKNCQVTVTESVSVSCEPDNTQHVTSEFKYEAELVNAQLGISHRLASTLPTFRFYKVMPASNYTLKIFTLSDQNGSERTLHFKHNIHMKEGADGGTLGSPTNSVDKGLFLLNDDEVLERILPLVGVSGILIFAFIVIMIVVSMVRRSHNSILNDKSLHTHIAFNRCLDPEQTSADRTIGCRAGIQRVHSLDQLNQVTFQGFSSDTLHDSIVPSKYHTLPTGGVSVISVMHHNSASDGSIVKRVTFAKGTASSLSSSGEEDSSNDSVRTIRDNTDYMNVTGPDTYEESSLI